MESDIDTLLAMIDSMAELTGESPEDDDAILLQQIRDEHRKRVFVHIDTSTGAQMSSDRIPSPQPGGALKATVGYSLANKCWWVRIYPCASEQDAHQLGRRILSALEPSPSQWNAGAEAMKTDCVVTIESFAPGGENYEPGRDDASMRVAIRGAILALPLPTPPAGEG